MTPFAHEGGVAVASFEPAEVEILARLASEVQDLLTNTTDAAGDAIRSPAIDRLLPAGYGDDGENDAEFRRFTSEGLIERKVRNAQVIIETLSSVEGFPRLVELDAAASQAWLRGLTDIRLSIAADLGIEHDDDELHIADGDLYLLEVYRWLAFVQESLIDTLEIHSS